MQKNQLPCPHFKTATFLWLTPKFLLLPNKNNNNNNLLACLLLVGFLYATINCILLHSTVVEWRYKNPCNLVTPVFVPSPLLMHSERPVKLGCNRPSTKGNAGYWSQRATLRVDDQSIQTLAHRTFRLNSIFVFLEQAGELPLYCNFTSNCLLVSWLFLATALSVELWGASKQ